MAGSPGPRIIFLLTIDRSRVRIGENCRLSRYVKMVRIRFQLSCNFLHLMAVGLNGENR